MRLGRGRLAWYSPVRPSQSRMRPSSATAYWLPSGANAGAPHCQPESASMNACFSTSSRRTRTPGPVTIMRVPSGDITPCTSSEDSPDPSPTTSPDFGSTRKNDPS